MYNISERFVDSLFYEFNPLFCAKNVTQNIVQLDLIVWLLSWSCAHKQTDIIFLYPQVRGISFLILRLSQPVT